MKTLMSLINVFLITPIAVATCILALPDSEQKPLTWEIENPVTIDVNEITKRSRIYADGLCMTPYVVVTTNYCKGGRCSRCGHPKPIVFDNEIRCPNLTVYPQMECVYTNVVATVVETRIVFQVIGVGRVRKQ